LIVWLDRPRWQCTLRAIGRVFRGDSNHRIGGLVKVLRFIANFERVNRPRIEALRIKHGPRVSVAHLKSDREIEAFVRDFSPVAKAPA
jgi:hypothetical protein